MLWHLVYCLLAVVGTTRSAGKKLSYLSTRVLTVTYSFKHTFLDPPTALLVVGGGVSSVELVDLTDGSGNSCISPVGALNYEKNAAGILVDNNPTVCGGGEYYSYNYSDKCASY